MPNPSDRPMPKVMECVICKAESLSWEVGYKDNLAYCFCETHLEEALDLCDFKYSEFYGFNCLLNTEKLEKMRDDYETHQCEGCAQCGMYDDSPADLSMDED